ncbi:hypothetical protein Bca101_020513 [Brassica carinata]
MESGILLVALIATFAVIHLSQAEDQEGFISLDCGLAPSEASPYIEPDTGLWFSSDSDFIQSGKIGKIDPSLPKTIKTYVTLRYFPDGIRNCYNLSVKQGTNYLMRFTALYGNYDGLNITPKFDVYVGPNFWVTIDLANKISGQSEEIIYIPRSNALDLCLVKTGTTTPMVSSVELRPLANHIYITESGSLKSFKRYYITSSDTILSYPNDVEDRIWEPKFDPEWMQISTTLEANNSNGFLVPQNILKTAAIPANDTAPFNITEELDFPDDQIYLYLHFSEVQALPVGDFREFDIFWNGQQFDKTIRPEYLKTTTIYSTTPVTCKGGVCNLELIRTTNSILPPLLNAIELYTVKFLWDGLNCNSTDISTPPIITYLNLSSNGLEGTIAAAIQNLTHLEKLDLSNNNLTGEVPEFLANMKSLMLINLSKNNLIGFIPQALLEREKEGLQLIVDGEHRCLSGSCVSVTEKKIPVKTVAFVSSATVMVIIVVLVLIFVLKKKKSSSSEGKHDSSVLKWSTRLQIAIDAALGLEYLHIGCRPPMVHRDVKSTNILLDERFTAKLADFGLSRSFQLGGENHVLTVVAGTPGYLDPECYRTGRMAELSDVYSFGIVLLEIITNQDVVDQTREMSHIAEWTAFMLNRGDIAGIMDPNLHGDYNSHSAWRALELAMLCANPSSENRPNMFQVVIELKECLTSEITMKDNGQDMDSQSSPKVSMSYDTKELPSAR